LLESIDHSNKEMRLIALSNNLGRLLNNRVGDINNWALLEFTDRSDGKT